MKRHLLLLALAAVLSGTAIAADSLPTPTPAPGSVSSAQHSAVLNRLKTRGASEIDRRLSALQPALVKVQSNTTLSSSDQQAIIKLIQDEIDSLTALKTKLAAETSLDKARTDVQAIITDYAVYGLILPQARLIATIDRTTISGKKYQELLAHLQRKVTQATDQGYDVDELQKRLDDMKEKLDEAQAKYDGLPGKVIGVPVTDYAQSHKTLREHRDAMKAIRAIFKSSHDDAEAVIQGLKNLKKATPTPSASPSLSPSSGPKTK